MSRGLPERSRDKNLFKRISEEGISLKLQCVRLIDSSESKSSKVSGRELINLHPLKLIFLIFSNFSYSSVEN